jgi:hypothetical protein
MLTFCYIYVNKPAASYLVCSFRYMRSFQVMVLAVILSALNVNAQDSTDVQVWNETTISIPVIKSIGTDGKKFDRLSAVISGTFRVGGDVLQGGDARITLGFDYRINKFLTIQPTYVYRAEKTSGRHRTFESRYRFAVGLQHDWKNVKLRHRSMIDHRELYSRPSDQTFYRSRFQVLFPTKSIEPYLMDEVFYQFDNKQITANRLFIGFNRKLSKNVSIDPFYLWQHNRSGSVKTIHAFGANLRIRIE